MTEKIDEAKEAQKFFDAFKKFCDDNKMKWGIFVGSDGTRPVRSHHNVDCAEEFIGLLEKTKFDILCKISKGRRNDQ